MAESVLLDSQVQRAVSNVKPRSERVEDLTTLERTYVETGVLPQLLNENNQILYGRRGTGKSHVLRMLGAKREGESASGAPTIYIDVRLLGSAQLMSDPGLPMTSRCVSVFRDLLAILQSELLDIATDPRNDGKGIQEVSEFADAVVRTHSHVNERKVGGKHAVSDTASAGLGFSASPAPSVSVDFTSGRATNSEGFEEYSEVYRETIRFVEIAYALERAIDGLGLTNLLVLIDEWTAIPTDIQPFVAEFLKRIVFPCSRITVKIASLEYRSNYTLVLPNRQIVGFELGADIAANLDLDDYYVYDRNSDHVGSMFLELLWRHVSTLMDPATVAELGLGNSTSFRSRLFTEPATFLELVRAGEGVVRDFLGIFTAAFFRALRAGNAKIDMHSVEEAAREWYETDKSHALSDEQRRALDQIVSEVIGSRQTQMFMLARENASHPMVQSLFDLRLIHLISRGYSDKENPGLRYNIYALDYGTYVDLKRTKVQPEAFIAELDDAPSSADRIVPFADKRSIRRVILQPAIFDAPVRTVS